MSILSKVENYSNWSKSNSENLPTYLCLETESGFTFVTDNLITYEIYFIEGESYLPGLPFSSYTFVFGFHPLSPLPDKQASDPKVSATIAAKVLDFFDDPRAVLLYTCDQSDARERYRKRLFDIWYRQYGKEVLVKMDQEFDNTLFLSAIARKDNPFLSELQESFADIGQNLK